MQLSAFLRHELASRPGRFSYVTRITILTVLTVILSEVFQIPEPAYSAYVVFFISKEETASTFLTSIVVIIAITLSVFLALGIYMVSAGEPGLRLPLMVAIVFISMFISRTSSLGTAAFVIGFLITISLTLIDVIPPISPYSSADILTRAVLWLWVVVMMPVALVILGNVLLLKKNNQRIDQLPDLKSIKNRKIKLEKPKQQQLFVPDAFSNPAYVHYALKATCAIFIAYITYNMLNWPEIRTCMITCFFVALGSTGETFHKMTLRIIGAIIGGSLGLLTIIFLMPYLTTIIGLCLVIAVVSFFAAWVATSSELLSYAGLQIALAFFISVLVGYGPSIDLTLARDRIIGILLGNLIVFVVFSMIWPVSSITQARSSLIAALKKLSQIFSLDSTSIEQQEKRDALCFALGNDLSQARRLVALNRFEPTKPDQLIIDEKLIDGIQAFIAPTSLLDEQISGSTTTYAEISLYKKFLSERLSLLAKQISNEKPSTSVMPNNLESVNSDRLLPIGYVDWMHTLDRCLLDLDRLLRREGTPPEKEFNQSGREML